MQVEELIPFTPTFVSFMGRNYTHPIQLRELTQAQVNEFLEELKPFYKQVKRLADSSTVTKKKKKKRNTGQLSPVVEPEHEPVETGPSCIAEEPEALSAESTGETAASPIRPCATRPIRNSLSPNLKVTIKVPRQPEPADERPTASSHHDSAEKSDMSARSRTQPARAAAAGAAATGAGKKRTRAEAEKSGADVQAEDGPSKRRKRQTTAGKNGHGR